MSQWMNYAPPSVRSDCRSSSAGRTPVGSRTTGSRSSAHAGCPWVGVGQLSHIRMAAWPTDGYSALTRFPSRILARVRPLFRPRTCPSRPLA